MRSRANQIWLCSDQRGCHRATWWTFWLYWVPVRVTRALQRCAQAVERIQDAGWILCCPWPSRGIPKSATIQILFARVWRRRLNIYSRPNFWRQRSNLKTSGELKQCQLQESFPSCIDSHWASILDQSGPQGARERSDRRLGSYASQTAWDLSSTNIFRSPAKLIRRWSWKPKHLRWQTHYWKQESEWHIQDLVFWRLKVCGFQAWLIIRRSAWRWLRIKRQVPSQA